MVEGEVVDLQGDYCDITEVLFGLASVVAGLVEVMDVYFCCGDAKRQSLL